MNTVRQCPPPNQVDGGEVFYQSQFFESDATYHAKPNYVFENHGTVRTTICQTGGRWSAESPKLKRERQINICCSNNCTLTIKIFSYLTALGSNLILISASARKSICSLKLMFTLFAYRQNLSTVTRRWIYFKYYCELCRCPGKNCKNIIKILSRSKKVFCYILLSEKVNIFQVEIRCKNTRAKLENGLPKMTGRCGSSGKWTNVPKTCDGVSDLFCVTFVFCLCVCVCVCR